MKQIKVKDLLNIGLSKHYVENICLRIKEYKRNEKKTKQQSWDRELQLGSVTGYDRKRSECCF